MFISIFKIAAAGVLGLMLLLAIPFLIFKAFIFFLLFGVFFRLIRGRRTYRRWAHHHPYYRNYQNRFDGIHEREGLYDRFAYDPKPI